MVSLVCTLQLPGLLCVCIMMQDTSNTHRDAILQQACYSKGVWDLAITAMDLFQEGRLKGQKIKVSSLISQPEFKQQYLAPIRALDPADQINLLTKLTEKNITLNELKTEAQQIKSMHTLQSTFVRLTNMDNWENAKEKLPGYANQLSRFLQCDLRKNVPSNFIEFCMRSKR